MFERRSTLAQRATLLALALLFTAICYRFASKAREWGPELSAVNTLFHLRGPRPARNDFLMVSIDNQKKKLLDSKGNVNRHTLATLIRRAKSGGARAIVVDVYLPNRTTHAVDRDLWEAVARSGNVFLPAVYLPDRTNVLSPDDIRNLKFLEESVLTGEVDRYGPLPPGFTWWKFQAPVSDFTHSAAGKAGGVGVAPYETDADGVLRRTRMAYLTNIVYPPTTSASRLINQGNVNNVVMPSLAIPVTNFVLKVDKHLITVGYNQRITYAATLNPPINIPVDEQGRMLINYVGPVGRFPSLNAADVLNGKTPPKSFNDKIVFIGITEGNQAGFAPTPYSPASPRVDVTANSVATVLDRAFLTQSVAGAWVPLGLLALFLALTFPFFTAVGATVWAVLCGAGYAILSWAVFTMTAFGILPLVPAFLMILLFWLATLALRPVLVVRRSEVVYA